ncbi:WXG100 family type VII secretion target [Saccharopolyspora shandongensis]|uniref:WXG100 family type VII secretion target n=1 Tax=Saccharopolyspora shandongensis TaxID=418495 RepID=UPI0033F59B89
MTLEEMKATNARVKAALEEMEQNVEKTLAEWTGSAQNAYWDAKAVWNQQAAQMPVYLGQAGQTLANIAQNYGLSDSQSAKLWADSHS